jgi:Glycosyltransferase family 87
MFGRANWAFVSLIVSSFLMVVLLSILAASSLFSPTPVSRLIALLIGAHAVYVLVVYFAWKARLSLCVGWPVVVAALLLRCIMLPAPEVFSDDINRYVWDGRVLAEGINPYQFAPDAPELEFLRDTVWTGINHPTMRTIYPPLAEIIFAGLAIISPSTWFFKLVSVLADVGVVCLVILLAGGSIRKKSHRAGNRIRTGNAVFAGVAYGLNPLPIVETGMCGHLDSLAVLATLSAIYLIHRKRKVLASVLIALGCGIKLLPILILPSVAKRLRFAVVVVPLLLGLLYLPFFSVGLATVETLDAFVRRWEGNAGLFALLKTSIETVIGALSGVSHCSEMIHIEKLDAVATALQGTFFSLHKDGGFDPTAPGAFALQDIALAATKLILGCVMFAAITIATIRRYDPSRAALFIFGTLVVITPVLHPWYLLWVLPLSAVLRFWPFAVLAALSSLAYLPLDYWWSHGVWKLPNWVPWLEWGMFAMAVGVYFILTCNKKGSYNASLGQTDIAVAPKRLVK